MRGSGGGSRYYRAKARPHFFQDLNLNTILEPADPTEGCFVASKVVATLGPSCSDVDTLAALLEAGMTVARVDLTWGPLPYHKRSLANLNTAMKRVRRMCAVMVDTLGREMLIKRRFTLGPDGWPLHESPFKVCAGAPITITTRADVEASPELLPITYDKFPSLVQPGDIVYIGRYLACGAPEQASLYLKVQQVSPELGDVVCMALNDAELHGLLTVFNLERSASELVGLQSDLPVMTDYDKLALRELAAEGFEIDFVSISYCRSGADVREVRSFTEGVEGLRAAALVAKVETRQALFNFRGILDAADGITVSRGLLGLDCVPEKVALIQKSLISACNLVGKPVVITRVLDSMTDNPRPTRAEATDVANAVLDGADALFLGSETLRGKYPVATVRTLVSIARQAERVFDFRHHFEWLMQAAMDAQEVRDAIAAGYGAPGWAGGGLDDDDAATDIFMLTGGMGMGMGGPMGHHGSSFGPGGLGVGSIGAGLAGLGGGGTAGEYGPVGGMTPLATAGGGAAGLSPASSNLEELVADGGLGDAGTPMGSGGGGGGGGGAAGGGGGHHVSFAGLPPRPPGRTRSNASMPDVNVVVVVGGGGGTAGGGASLSASGASPLAGPGGAGGAGSTIAPPSQPGSRSQSYADINTAVAAMNRFGTGPRDAHAAMSHGGTTPGSIYGGSHAGGHHGHHGAASHHGGRASPSVRSTTGTLYGGGPTGPYMGKLESIASSAVRAAEKVKASLIVVYTHTSRVASLVAKYRPPMPILTLVVPRLTSDGLHWRLQGRGHARQCLMVRGLLPMLSAPGPSGDEVLEEAIAMSSRLGLVAPGHHVVVVERVHDAFCLKIVAVDELGLGIQRDGPLDPTAVVVRAMVPATPVVGRTLSMMQDARLPSPAALMAAAARGSGGAATANALGIFGGGGGGSDRDVNFGGGGGGGRGTIAMGTVMGTINSMLAGSPSTYDGPAFITADDTGLPGSGGGGGGLRPRRQTSGELIGSVPRSPFSSSPPTGAGLVPNTGGAGGAGGAGSSSNARVGLFNVMLGAASQTLSPGGGGGGANGPACLAAGLIPGAAGGSSPASISLASRPVLNALGGGIASQDGLLPAAMAAAGGGAGEGAFGGVGGGGGVTRSPVTRGSLLGTLTEEPEGLSPFTGENAPGGDASKEGGAAAAAGGAGAGAGAGVGGQ